MFEAYQREARAARDKKDREEIEALRNEVSGFLKPCDDMHTCSNVAE